MDRTCAIALIAFLSVTLFPRTATAQLKVLKFENSGYFDPQLAEIRPPAIHLMVIGVADSFPVIQEVRSQLVWDIGLGVDVPWLSWERSESLQGALASGRWGLSLSTPVSFHMIEALKSDSAPILNTDYRFGVTGKFARGWGGDNSSGRSRREFGLKLHLGHESTHMGDEVAVAGQRGAPGNGFSRINVSFEYYEMAARMKWILRDERGEVEARAGFTELFADGKGFYSAISLETNRPERVSLSKEHFEPYVAFAVDRKVKASSLQLAIELRHRVVLDYHKETDQESEDRKLSTNAILAYGLGGHVEDRPSLFLRVYHGVNPAGQFRNQRTFRLIGFGLHVPVF